MKIPLHLILIYFLCCIHPRPTMSDEVFCGELDKFLFSYYAYFSFPSLEKASPIDSSVLIKHFLGVAMHTRVNSGLS